MTKFPIVEPEISNYLACLSKEEIDEAIMLFHQKELTIAQIIDKFNLGEIPIGSFVKHLPPSQHYDLVCPQCKVVSWIDQKARDKKSKPYCPKCKEILIEDYNPKERQRVLRAQKEGELWIKKNDPNYYENELIVTEEKYRSLSLFSKVFLGSIVQAIVEDDLSTVKGKLLKEFKLYPIGYELNDKLTELGISDEFEYTDYLYKIDESVSKKLLKCEDKLESTLNQQFDLWKDIAMVESKEYLIGEMEENRFHFHHDNKFQEVFGSLLETHSVSQTFHLVNKSVSDACKYYAQTGTRYLAENSIIGRCDKMAAYYPTRDWPIRNYDRRHYFQSLMSQYFFNKVLKIGNKGFIHPPSLELLIHLKMGY